MDKRQLLLDLYAAISAGKTDDELARFFTPDAIQVEYPSLMRPHGSKRTLEAMREASIKGAGLIVDQTYELHTYVQQGEHVAVQFTWRARTAVGLGALPAGTALVAHVAAFYVFEGDLIRQQSSYDCYEPIAA